MTQITVAWRASEKLRRMEYAVTGERPDANRKFQLDLAVELTATQRKPIVEHLGLYCFMLDMRHTHGFSESMPASSYLPAYSQDYDHWSPVYLNEPPSWARDEWLVRTAGTVHRFYLLPEWERQP